jgi:hypothetical protein
LNRERVPAGLGGVRNAYKVFVRNLNVKTRIKNGRVILKYVLK